MGQEGRCREEQGESKGEEGEVCRDKGELENASERGRETYSTFHRWRPYT